MQCNSKVTIYLFFWTYLEIDPFALQGTLIDI